MHSQFETFVETEAFGKKERVEFHYMLAPVAMSFRRVASAARHVSRSPRRGKSSWPWPWPQPDSSGDAGGPVNEGG